MDKRFTTITYIKDGEIVSKDQINEPVISDSKIDDEKFQSLLSDADDLRKKISSFKKHTPVKPSNLRYFVEPVKKRKI